MLNVSAKWHEASQAQFRYQAYFVVALEVAPPGLRQGLSVASEDSYPNSNIENIKEKRNKGEYAKYATLERNRWLLDGEHNVMDENSVLVDWWSLNPATPMNAPCIRFTFDKAYTIPGISLTWDVTHETFPSKIRAVGYDSQGEATYNIEVTDITSYSGFFDDLAMDDVQTVDLFVEEWGLTNWRARLSTAIFGLVVDFDSINSGRIMSAKQTSKADPLNRKLPTHNLEVEFRNTDKYFDPMMAVGVSKYLAQQQVLRAKWQFVVDKGVVESAPEQVYLTETFDINTDSKSVKMQLTNRLAVLDGEFKLGTYTGTARSLKSIAEYVLSNASILTEYEGQTPWIIPNEFDSVTTLAPIPSGATNSVLQLIALAGSSWLTINSTDGFIEFTKSATAVSSDVRVTENQELGDPEITIQDQLRSVAVSVYNYSVATEAKEVGKGEYQVNGEQTLTLKYNVDYATNVEASVSGATLVTARYYASYATLTLVTSSEATVTVTLTGKEVSKTVAFIETYRNVAIADGMDVTIDNSLITDISHAQQVAAYVQNYYLKRTQYKLSYTGYPQLEPVDRIALSTVYGDVDVDVLGNTIQFNGGWSGTLEVL